MKNRARELADRAMTAVLYVFGALLVLWAVWLIGTMM
jgi:hypothetical protein